MGMEDGLALIDVEEAWWITKWTGKKKKQTKKHGKHHTSLLDICPSCSKGEEEEVLKKIGRSRKK